MSFCSIASTRDTFVSWLHVPAVHRDIFECTRLRLTDTVGSWVRWRTSRLCVESEPVAKVSCSMSLSEADSNTAEAQAKVRYSQKLASSKTQRLCHMCHHGVFFCCEGGAQSFSVPNKYTGNFFAEGAGVEQTQHGESSYLFLVGGPPQMPQGSPIQARRCFRPRGCRQHRASPC